MVERGRARGASGFCFGYSKRVNPITSVKPRLSVSSIFHPQTGNCTTPLQAAGSLDSPCDCVCLLFLSVSHARTLETHTLALACSLVSRRHARRMFVQYCTARISLLDHSSIHQRRLILHPSTHTHAHARRRLSPTVPRHRRPLRRAHCSYVAPVISSACDIETSPCAMGRSCAAPSRPARRQQSDRCGTSSS